MFIFLTQHIADLAEIVIGLAVGIKSRMPLPDTSGMVPVLISCSIDILTPLKLIAPIVTQTAKKRQGQNKLLYSNARNIDEMRKIC